MIRLIRFLITGDWHLHKWETIQEVGLSYFYCRCKHCGIIKKF